MGLIDKVTAVSKKIKNNRDIKDVSIKLGEECGSSKYNDWIIFLQRG